MKDFESDGSSEGEWDERGDLAWNEFDWEGYLRTQDENVLRYLAHYDSLKDHTERIDEVAERMGWDKSASTDVGSDDDDDDEEDSSEEFETSDDVYTLHKNPIFISTKAIYVSLRRQWLLLAGDGRNAPITIILPYLDALHRGEELAMQAIHALDFGDYAMAVALFKRALGALNQCFALLDHKAAESAPAFAAYQRDARQRLFDLREIWLRVISECRAELERPVEDDET